jgi:hypothetical protein
MIVVETENEEERWRKMKKVVVAGAEGLQQKSFTSPKPFRAQWRTQRGKNC